MLACARLPPILFSPLQHGRISVYLLYGFLTLLLLLAFVL